MDGGGGVKVVASQEYLMQGSSLESTRDMLLHRLIGLCDAVGPYIQYEKFKDHEMLYQLGSGPQAVVVRVRRSIEKPAMPYHIRYLGQPDYSERSKHALLRSCLEMGVSDNIQQVLTELGFKMDFEYSLHGYFFRKGHMKISVSRIVKGSNSDRADLSICKSFLVELSVTAPQGIDQIQDEMKNFAEQLKPLVNLEKVDMRRLQTQ